MKKKAHHPQFGPIAFVLVLIVTGLASTALAQKIEHRMDNIVFEVPDEWEADTNENELILSQPTEDLNAIFGIIFFWFPPPERHPFKPLINRLDKSASNVSTVGEPSKLNINGIDGLYTFGTGRIGEVNIVWSG